ncbi:MAG: ParA family protein [Archangium gephyra]|uniref:ParA family protein n=1 Tax=Archangium gephyra TaxID=48 RepID=A0A2W5SXU5_9BACT|nr:MAG: ParA family protein [Archangium gephyra]
MTRRIAFINEKGGVGKTTLAVNVAAFFALKRKQRVLLVDLDTQGHAAKTLGVDVRSGGPTVFDLLTKPGVEPNAVTRSTAVENLWLIPSWKEMAEFPTVAAADPERARLLSKKLVPCDGRYDVIVFDAPPSYGLVTTNVLLAAEEVVIPVATTYLALDGCAELVATVERLAKEYGHHTLRVTQIVPTMYRKTQLSDEIVEKLREYFPKKVCEPLGLNVAIDEAQSHGKTIWEHAPWSRGATLLQQVSERIERAR